MRRESGLFTVCESRKGLGTRLGLKWRRNGGLCVKVLTKLVSAKQRSRKTAHFTTIFGSNIWVICKRQRKRMKGRRSKRGWRKKWGGENHVNRACMFLSLHTPHLYNCVTVDLNSFVV